MRRGLIAPVSKDVYRCLSVTTAAVCRRSHMRYLSTIRQRQRGHLGSDSVLSGNSAGRPNQLCSCRPFAADVLPCGWRIRCPADGRYDTAGRDVVAVRAWRYARSLHTDFVSTTQQPNPAEPKDRNRTRFLVHSYAHGWRATPGSWGWRCQLGETTSHAD